MKIFDILESTKEKIRPKKTLWFDDYRLWVQDIQDRFPDAQAYADNEDEEILALDSTEKKCYGKWNKVKNNGVSYANDRPLHVAIHPSRKFSRLNNK